MGWFSNSQRSKSQSDLVLTALNKSLAVIEFEPSGRILTANSNFLNVVDYGLADIQGQHHSMFVEPDEVASSEYQQFWQRLKGGEFISNEFKRIGNNGKKIWIQATYNPVIDSQGQVIKVVKFATDISEQKSATEEAIRIANLANALEVCQANVMIADNDLKIIFVNEQVKQMLQARESQLQTVLPSFAVENLIGTCVDDFHKQPAHQRQLLASLNDPYKATLRLAGLIFSLIATPWLSRDGERLGTIVEWQDITDSVNKAEEEKREAEENLRVRRALDRVATNTMIANADNDIIYMNESVLNMMTAAEADIRKDLPNFNSSKLLGQNIDVFHKNPAHQQHLLSKLTNIYSTEINVGGRTFGLVANPIFTPEKERIGTVVEWEDRTDEVAIEKEMADLVSAAGKGELKTRVNEAGKEGFYLRLAKGLNSLVSIVDDAVTDTGIMLDAMANGDLSIRIEKEYQGSFDKLKTDANATADKLTEVINRINSSATMVASGAEEISQGNADLSQRTEEQASSLEETASSMEEMTSTVRQNADNAKVANGLAAETRDKAMQGGEVVNRAVVSMSAINESSKKIADIISVIDEIAFQTNLLALNAAVEAARAGEQGRGFAVVAGEVRNLAQRSAGAAKEIKELIRDSVGKVEDGTLLVNESGATLQDIVSSVQKVTEMISDITEASEEQSAGIEQVNKAISQMDEMTQQNAALVEQASAAGESMSEQANDMRRLLNFFSLSQQEMPGLIESTPTAKTPTRASQNIRSAPRGNDFADSSDEWEEF
ncbi:chemotaxis protein [Pseudoalteromonas sp. A601]|uniref:methyl-accepting chemotaxis protein n=1 Tax=Pseudoalteromonas sp. A601 TaxID=1967839 RepID=UPI000B3C37BF|nr:methyl-accepting chemotaxis protein [Pseudoalteromonas sp. A601]OUS71804.1 chemotaxis protein [Pseudoalteromonas sp. A601]